MGSVSSHKTQQPLVQFSQPSLLDARQKLLAKKSYWEEFDELLVLDARQLFPTIGVVAIPSWDKMMLDGEAIPDYPTFLKLFDWPRNQQLDEWLKQIPKWVQDSCKLFPSHQLTLLHYVAKYPQLFELLDHSPVLAWRLVTSGLQEPEIIALMAGNRQQLVQQLGWPGKAETVKLLRNLRLRFVNAQIAEQIETCILDPKRLDGLQKLPRVNSMALSLAVGFPLLIGSQLHHSLAQLPCRPMQCQAMVAQLEDVFVLLQLINREGELDQIAKCRYLTEVEDLYKTWLFESLKAEAFDIDNSLFDCKPRVVEREDELLWLSEQTLHPWSLLAKTLPENQSLVAWCEEPEEGNSAVWVAQIMWPEKLTNEQPQVLKLRGLGNSLGQAKQLSDLHLWLLQQLPKKTD